MKKGILLVLFGVIGAVFVCTFDIITQKPVNDITGPKSISALVVCTISLAIGIYFLVKSRKKKSTSS